MAPKKKQTGTQKPAGPEKAPQKRRRERRAKRAGEPAAKKSGDRRSAQAARTKRAASDAPFPVIGIGASAGGLEALEIFFENLPDDTGMAFVVITHTSPDHTSLLPEIIARKTGMAVKEAEEGMPLSPDTVYLPPTGHDLILQSVLRLKKRLPEDDLHMPVDLFLRHLAEACGTHSCGVILSGTGTDGSYGLRMIKENEGLTIAQSPDSARHKGMPASAINTGLVDFVLPAGEMPARILEVFKKAPAGQHPPQQKEKTENELIEQIVDLLFRRTRHDFSLYKSSTLRRRIDRRKVVCKAANTRAYLDLLLKDEQEVEQLFNDMVIGVTTFFRDPEAFAYLQRHAAVELVRRKQAGRPLRVWVPGCSTGEEAYSVAILLKESLEQSDGSRDLQIFATDIDPRAVKTARNGTYLQNIAADVGQVRLERFFNREGERFIVRREIRETIVFAEQDVLRDPPFSELDLLVCRNLLIYLKTEAQDMLIPMFHHVLNKEGFLFMGSAESVNRFPALFEPLGASQPIFRRKETLTPPPARFPTDRTARRAPAAEKASRAGKTARGGDDPIRAAQRILLEEYAPACIIVGRDGGILQTHGRTGKYLELKPGKANLNIREMAREGLYIPLLSALRRASNSREPIVEKGLRVKTNHDYQQVDLTVRRFDRAPLEDALMVVLQDSPVGAERIEPRPAKDDERANRERVAELEQELTRISEDYHTVREELEIANEELRSANEEMQSSNEELQSTNEELESSREELQSLNEELSTVNSEMESKIQELDKSFTAITQVLDSTGIAFIFLDTRLRVQRFTSAAGRLVNLIASDIGRPLQDVSHNLEGVDPVEMAGRVLKELSPIEEEVCSTAGHWYRMSIIVHRRDDRKIEGVVLTFIDIDRQKAAQARIEELNRQIREAAARYTESIVDTVRESLLVLDEDMRVLTANRRFYNCFETNPANTEGRRLFELGDGQWDIAELRRLLEKTSRHRKPFEDLCIEKTFSDIGTRKLLMNCRHLRDDVDNKNKILLAIQDVSEKN